MASEISPVVAQAVSTPIAQDFSPPDDWSGLGQREGGGTRGGLVIQGTPLIALMPDSNFGTTLTPNPTFFFYIPIEVAGLDAEFVLMDEAGTVLYQAIAPLPSQQGIVSLELPASVRIEPGRNYQWFFSVLVSPDDRTSDISVYGGVQRRIAEPALAQQIATTPASARPALYSQANVWYEALSSLAELRQANPEDAALQQQWLTLLESVGLEALATQPFLDALTPSETLSSDASASGGAVPTATAPNQTYSIPDLPDSPSRELRLRSPEGTPPEGQSLRTGLSIEEARPTTQSIQNLPNTSFYTAPDIYMPPDTRVPGRREGGSTRGGVPVELIPLVPANDPGITLSANPTFLFYAANPAAVADRGEFVLIGAQGDEVYYINTTLTPQNGIVSVTLPASVSLEPEQDYQWFFEILANEDDRSRNPIVGGWVRRRMVEPALAQQIANTPLPERPALYGQLGVWYDALSMLAALRRANPEDQSLQQQWTALLEFVESEVNLANQPLLEPLDIQVETLPIGKSSAIEATPTTAGSRFYTPLDQDSGEGIR